MAQVANKVAKNAKSKLSQKKEGGGGGGKGKQATLHEQVMATIKRMQANDPGLKRLMEKAYGYAVFPSVGKAALVLGGAYGRGEVFEQGKMIGHATIAQLTIGVQLGGDTFDELIVFESRAPFQRFKQGRTKFAANASAVMVKSGAAASSNFEKGAVVFVQSEGGMLLELAIGGQKFKFKPGRIGDAEQSQQGGKGKAATRGGARGGKAESDEGQTDGEGEDDQTTSTIGAVTKAFGLVKNHPILAAMVGAGVAFYAVSKLTRAASRDSGHEDDSEEDYDEEDEDSEAEGSYEDEGEEEEDEDRDQDEDDESDARDEEEEEDADEEDDEGDEEEDEEEESSRSTKSRRR